MRIGTKSVLFGAHCFFIHPFVVALAWWKLYGFPSDWRLWLAFFVHDIGYFGKPNLDGPEGETHPETGSNVMLKVCRALGSSEVDAMYWHDFSLYHSRYYSKKNGKPYSKLCVADKMATAMEWHWLYLPRVFLTGEIHEYMKGEGARTPGHGLTASQWFSEVQRICREWAEHHKELKPDVWTGTQRDLAKKS